VIAQLAVWKLGAVVAALNPIYTESELGALLRADGRALRDRAHRECTAA
jgi:acyl-CoA synthetase (AMP-forming)/AMP-acid ligase II